MLDRQKPTINPARSVADESETVPELFLKRIALTPAAPAWKRKVNGQWVTSTWHDFYGAACSVATFLLDKGIMLGDKVVIVGSTRPEWCIADIAGLLAGAVTVGAYATLTAEQLGYILDHSDARLAFVEDREQLDKILQMKSRLPRLETLVVWDTNGTADLLAQHGFLQAFNEVLRTQGDRKRVEARAGEVRSEQTAIIVYTSGTTGPPKGAMISHSNIVVLLRSNPFVQHEAGDVSLVFLPMAHVAERVLSFYGRITYGTAAAYASSVPAVLGELREVRPTVFGSVPRIFEKAYAQIQAQVSKSPASKQKLFRWAELVGERAVRAWQSGQSLPVVLHIQHELASRLVFKKLRDVFGGKVRYFVTGAAPIPKSILEFFWAAGLPIYEAYGMTESTAISHSNRPGAVRLGSVGKPLEFIEDKIADDGEILVRGKTVFQGYYKDEAATAEMIDTEGWLHTGDIGKRDADGFLYIVDRKKHIIITSGGKNLTPANIENEIKTQDPLISQVHAHGDRRAYVTALVTIGPMEALDFAREHGLVADASAADRIRLALAQNPLAQPAGLPELMTKVTSHPELRERLIQAVRRGNQKLSRVEQVKRVYLLDRELSASEDEITPTLKVKRKTLEQKFAPIFDRLYDDPAFGLMIIDH